MNKAGRKPLDPQDGVEACTMLLSRNARLDLDQFRLIAEKSFGIRLRSRGIAVEYIIKLAMDKQKEMLGAKINKDVESIV
jgi:hypothetical protein